MQNNANISTQVEWSIWYAKHDQEKYMSLHFYLYQSPFVSEFIQAKGSMGSHREGILIEWKHSMGSAWAECAPLPCFSKESLADCVNLLVTLKPEMEKQLEHLENNAAQNQNGLPIFFDFEYAERATQALYTSTEDRFPSVQFALSMLLYDWASQRENRPLNCLFSDHAHELATKTNAAPISAPSHSSTVHANTIDDSCQITGPISDSKDHLLQIPVNALIPITNLEESLELAKKAWLKGFRTIKMKVGPNHESNLNRLAKIQDALPGISYRLDPNGQWESESLKPFEKDYESYAIEYIEQAVPPDMFITFCHERSSKAPSMAADESSVEFSSFIPLLGQKNISFFVLKPTLSGGIPEMIQRCVLAHEKGQSCIFSSAFDGIITRHTLACLGWMNNQLNGRRLAHGIDTGRWLIENYSSPKRKLIPEVHEGIYSLNPNLFDGQAHHSNTQNSKNFQTLDSLITRSALVSIAV